MMEKTIENIYNIKHVNLQVTDLAEFKNDMVEPFIYELKDCVKLDYNTKYNAPKI